MEQNVDKNFVETAKRFLTAPLPERDHVTGRDAEKNRPGEAAHPEHASRRVDNLIDDLLPGDRGAATSERNGDRK